MFRAGDCKRDRFETWPIAIAVRREKEFVLGPRRGLERNVRDGRGLVECGTLGGLCGGLEAVQVDSANQVLGVRAGALHAEGSENASWC